MEEEGELERSREYSQAEWCRWREASVVLCDKCMPLKLKDKYYTTAVRPAMMYSAEFWAIKQSHEQKLHVAEMKMLRMMCGVTRRDRLKNEYVRASVNMDSIVDKLAQVSRLR